MRYEQLPYKQKAPVSQAGLGTSWGHRLTRGRLPCKQRMPVELWLSPPDFGGYHSTANNRRMFVASANAAGSVPADRSVRM